MRVLAESANNEYEVFEINNMAYSNEFYIPDTDDENDYQGCTYGLTFTTSDGTLYAIPGLTPERANMICMAICVNGYVDLSSYGPYVNVTNLPYA